MDYGDNGVFSSTFPDVELPNQNFWAFLQPKLMKYSDRQALVSIYAVSIKLKKFDL